MQQPHVTHVIGVAGVAGVSGVPGVTHVPSVTHVPGVTAGVCENYRNSLVPKLGLYERSTVGTR